MIHAIFANRRALMSNVMQIFIWKLNAILLDIMMIHLLGRDSRTNILEYSYYHRVVDTRNSLPRNTSVGQQVLILVK